MAACGEVDRLWRSDRHRSPLRSVQVGRCQQAAQCPPGVPDGAVFCTHGSLGNPLYCCMPIPGPRIILPVLPSCHPISLVGAPFLYALRNALPDRRFHRPQGRRGPIPHSPIQPSAGLPCPMLRSALLCRPTGMIRTLGHLDGL